MTNIRLPIGINGADGQYVPAPDRPIEDLLREAVEAGPAPLRRRKRGLEEDIDPRDLALTGWSVLFAAADPRADEIREALKPLLDHRRLQAGDRRYREYFGPEGYLSGDTKMKFLQRKGLGPGPVNPDRSPYYLLIVGDPETIPYDFQYPLDFQYAVGRICFDTIEEYARYANAVVASEQASLRSSSRRAVLFGTRHDPMTELSVDSLINPLARSLRGWPGWDVQALTGAEATKAHLSDLICSENGPDLLFTASHGLFFYPDEEQQRDLQGALICQDWPGHGHKPEPEHYFCGEDVARHDNPSSRICFHFACYSGGSPAWDDFAHLTKGVARQQRALHPFVSRLMQNLLSEGAALAAVGHVEGAWLQSFLWGEAGSQVQAFSATFKRLMAGQPIGAAVESLNVRYGELAAELIERIDWNADPDEALHDLWIACRDARNYTIVGDPAVRIGAVS